MLIQSAVETNSIKFQQYAFEIPFSLSFYKDILNILEQATKFMTTLKTLSISSKQSVQRTVNHLLWQVEQTKKTHLFLRRVQVVVSCSVIHIITKLDALRYMIISS